MDFETFKNNFETQLEEAPETALTQDTLFKNLPTWDSMTALMVIDMFDADYGKTISNEHIKTCKTLGDLFELAK
ncbi:MAG: acyl carrier protein [Bacteroidia bacterium]|jgi:acyl carrier protein